MKKIIFFIIWYFIIIKQSFASISFSFGPFDITIWGFPTISWGWWLSPIDIKSNIIPNNNILINNKDNWEELLFSVFSYIRNWIFWLLALISIWALIFVGARLLMARWNPEEFKKALTHFIYIIIWIVLVALSWAIVTMVSNLTW